LKCNAGHIPKCIGTVSLQKKFVMVEFLKTYKWKVAGIIIGATAGFAYWYYIGCTSGTCPIQSNWHTSTLYGGLVGYILPKNPPKNSVKNETEKGEEN
jgi:hypothetical protein